MRKLTSIAGAIATVVTSCSLAFAGSQLPVSQFDIDLAQLRLDNSVFAQKLLQTQTDNGATVGQTGPKRLSPGKAFVMSLVVPGLGQFYNGSKVKAAGFLALDVTSWLMHFKYRSDGNDLTDKFNAFADQYWAQGRYEEYLSKAYNGKTDDDSITATEVSHHLPDTKTQQYYEMIGKYDQFSWGWDDASLNDSSINQFTIMFPAVASNIPYSAHRLEYEIMRENANNKFDASDKWMIVSLANHIISAFDALISARRHNNNAGGGEFGRLKIRADLRSFASRHDTPYLRCSYAL